MNYFVSSTSKTEPAENSPATLELPLQGEHSPAWMTSQWHTNRNNDSTTSFFKRQVIKRFQKLGSANVRLVSKETLLDLGDPDEGTASHPDLIVAVENEDFYRRIFLGGTIGSAESYMAGEWGTNDLTLLIRVMIRNLSRFTKLESGWARLKNSVNFMQHAFRRNSIKGSRQNIHEHYDLGNDFYKLFLDPTMNYSSGIFGCPEIGSEGAKRAEATDRTDSAIDDMHGASIRKMETICDHLNLSADDHVLEIGTGWGAMAIHIAKNHGCKVTTTTISAQQHKLAVERIAAAGLSERIEVLQKDYRELTGQFDRIVSVEMIEAVGHQYYDAFFEVCNRLLREDGRMLLQAITIGEQHYDYHISHVDFIRKYIFPGGCLPSISALTRSVGRVTNMRMVHQSDITPHYARTLASWRTQFMSQLDEVKRQGYDDQFIRLWHFYLCYCEAAFAERRVHCVHLMFAKPDFN